jgi:hypothetical protein
LVDVICDTSFLIQLATKKIKNIDNLETEIGEIKFVVPEVVIKELENLSNDEKKKHEAMETLNFIKKLKTISISGNYADQALLFHVKEHGGIIATMDKELKNKVKSLGASIITLSNDRIILDS